MSLSTCSVSSPITSLTFFDRLRYLAIPRVLAAACALLTHLYHLLGQLIFHCFHTLAVGCNPHVTPSPVPPAPVTTSTSVTSDLL